MTFPENYIRSLCDIGAWPPEEKGSLPDHLQLSGDELTDHLSLGHSIRILPDEYEDPEGSDAVFTHRQVHGE